MDWLQNLIRSIQNFNPGYNDSLERNAHIIYPLLAIIVVALIVGAILLAWKEQDISELEKTEFKREIILELRKQVGGMSADMISRAIGLAPLRTLKILEEMQTEGIMLSHTNTARLTIWRLKGVGGGASLSG